MRALCDAFPRGGCIECIDLRAYDAALVLNVRQVVQLVDFLGTQWTQKFSWRSFSLQTSSACVIFRSRSSLRIVKERAADRRDPY
ncbi:MAG: hypothetical protein L0Z53_15325 [Acidobacteriales bacterium]|nr:hypothetical protein [Terriglobales bacterium]